MSTSQDPQQDEKRGAALEYFWGQYRVWAETAARHQRAMNSWRLRVLLLGVGAALLGALSDPRALPWREGWPTLGLPRSTFGVVGGLLLGLAAILTRELLGPERESRWLRARAAAEAFKRESYLLATGAPPYDGPLTRAQLDRGRGILAGVGDLQEEPVAEEERLKGLPPRPLSVDKYIELRLDDQIRYYRGKAGEHGAVVGRVRTLTLALGVAAFILGAMGGGGSGVWLVVITTVTASLAAYLYANRLQYLVGSYTAAARNLDALRVGWQTFGDEADDAERDRFIIDCEAVLSAESQSWIAEWSRTESGQKK
ncbi:MAG TPA: DUF4231 domain-containing protein [Pyrinomonadaceae bacterium]